MTKDEMKDRMKDKISMALKDPILQMGFEVICSKLARLEKENAELEAKISVLLSCTNCPENKGGWICEKEYENKCLTQKIEFIKELEEEKCELLGIIQGKDKVIQELEKENAELDCQMNRNKSCYSCANATDRCFKNEIGCPCEKYKSYKDENAELKEKLEVLIAVGNTCTKGLDKQLTKAKELIKEMLSILPKENIEGIYEITEEAEQFIREA